LEAIAGGYWAPSASRVFLLEKISSAQHRPIILLSKVNMLDALTTSMLSYIKTKQSILSKHVAKIIFSEDGSMVDWFHAIVFKHAENTIL
jgi:hypothetical protein